MQGPSVMLGPCESLSPSKRSMIPKSRDAHDCEFASEAAIGNSRMFRSSCAIDQTRSVLTRPGPHARSVERLPGREIECEPARCRAAQSILSLLRPEVAIRKSGKMA
jgi:hypothetical protein